MKGTNDIYFKCLGLDNEWLVWPSFLLEMVIHFTEIKCTFIIYTYCTLEWTICSWFSDLNTIFYYFLKEHMFKKWCVIDTCLCHPIFFQMWLLSYKIKLSFWRGQCKEHPVGFYIFFCYHCDDLEFSLWLNFSSLDFVMILFRIFFVKLEILNEIHKLLYYEKVDSMKNLLV